MVNRLLQASLGRATEDDRDHYGKKRLDMAGTLLAGLFRQLFRTFVEDMTKHIKKEIKVKEQHNKILSCSLTLSGETGKKLKAIFLAHIIANIFPILDYNFS